METNGQLPPKKRHAPNPENLDFDKSGLLLEVENLPSGSKVSQTISKMNYKLSFSIRYASV